MEKQLEIQQGWFGQLTESTKKRSALKSILHCRFPSNEKLKSTASMLSLSSILHPRPWLVQGLFTSP